jgi:hypothetical protein
MIFDKHSSFTDLTQLGLVDLRLQHRCRFRQLDSRVSMMEPTKNRVCNNISEPLDRACAGRVLPERNMSSYVIIIGDVFR